MTRLHPLAVAVCVALSGAPAFAGPVDVADVFPANTLAYVELHNPAEIGPQVAAALNGTPLQDSVPFIHGKKDEAKTLPELRAKEDLAALALFASPEVVAEFRKLGGVAVGLLGFTERGEPEFALAVLTGDSAAAGLAARAFVTATPNVRTVGEVSKVPVFQRRQPVVTYDMNGTPKLSGEKPKEEPRDLTCAYTPGLFVVGTSKAALAPVIKRFRAEEKDALGATAGFKEAAAEYRKPGLFFYAAAPGLFAAASAADRARGADAGADLLAWLKLTTNPKALKSIAGSARVRDGGLSLVAGGRFDPAEKSPLVDFFSGPGVKVEALHHARKPAALAATVTLPEKDRAAALIGFLDALAKGAGQLGRLPSDIAKDIGVKHKVAVNDVLAKVNAVTVVVPAKPDLPKGATPVPMFVIHAADVSAAAALEDLVPKLIAEISGEPAPAQPSTETVGGVQVRSLAGTGLPWKAAVHYARKDAVLAWGLDRKLVAAALTPDAAGSIVGEKGATIPPGAALAGAFDLGALVGALGEKPADGPIRPAPPAPAPGTGTELIPPDVLLKDADKARAALTVAFGQLPPTAVTVRRDRDRLVFEVFQPKITDGGLKPVINAWLDLFDNDLILRDPSRSAPGFLPPPPPDR
ncbi:hypothetical protein R5W23_003058 [Gemmata sp. JC673]|uniref:DUF3352 domain-containing protein n=1 Tax=Gemmata algarum TaxID=2975278 RepID=A0ABU5ER25_9BACT|nr:hypothetical protein [Gemmata algarum]MDY3557793.1 hypothetical protein [Gemmata algarum]